MGLVCFRLKGTDELVRILDFEPNIWYIFKESSIIDPIKLKVIYCIIVG
jgi:hypothetical protein